MISVWSVFETQSVITCGMKVRSILELGSRTHSDSVLFARSRDAQKQIEHELLQRIKKNGATFNHAVSYRRLQNFQLENLLSNFFQNILLNS